MLSLHYLKQYTLTSDNLGFTNNLLEKLDKLSIKNIYDLILNIPRRYINFNLKKLDEAEAGEEVTIQAEFVQATTTRISGGRKLIKLFFIEEETEQGFFATFFGVTFMATLFKPQEKVFVSGKFLGGLGYKSKTQFNHPKIEKAQNAYFASGINPVYPETVGITSKTIKKAILKALQEVPVEQAFDITKHNFFNLHEALLNIHNTKTEELAKKGIESLKILEFLDFFKYLNSIDKKQEQFDSLSSTEKIDIKKATDFELSKTQIKALSEIGKDLESKKFTRRVLVGETGSGKTIVAFLAVYKCFQSGNFSLILTPLLNLAFEHFETAVKLRLFPVGLLTGQECWFFDGFNKVKIPKTELYSLILQKRVGLLVATQAGFNQRFRLPENFGFLIIDEEQKFGVEQRKRLVQKNKKYPHVLKLTATPIPRSFALTFLKSFSLSFLDPRNKFKIETKALEKKNVFKIQKEVLQVMENHQVLVIYPRIEGTGNMQDELLFWQKFFKNFKIRWLTGQVKEKQRILEDFKNQEFEVLISTTVVEVGLNIPNLGAVIVVNAESLGLLTLHQVRGRVGRFFEGKCFLLSRAQEGLEKLRPLEKYSKGIDVARLDLESRGAGDIFGITQVGKSFKVASFVDEKEFKKAVEIFEGGA